MKAKSMFINLATQDVKKSRHFFTELGFELVKDYTNDTNNCFKVFENLYLMTTTDSNFEAFAKMHPVNSHQQREALLSIEVKSIEDVERLSKKILGLGGEVLPAVDQGFMYFRVFKDLDGHHFEIFSWK